MKFKEWILKESGHFQFYGKPRIFTVLINDKPVVKPYVKMIDPRFEFQDLYIKGKKFMGEDTFSLPIIDQYGRIIAYIVSKRISALGGSGHIQKEPEGVIAPKNWADRAILIGEKGTEL